VTSLSADTGFRLMRSPVAKLRVCSDGDLTVGPSLVFPQRLRESRQAAIANFFSAADNAVWADAVPQLFIVKR